MNKEDLVKDNKEIPTCPLCYPEDSYPLIKNDEGDSLIYYKDSDKNLVVAFNTFKHIDTRDCYSMLAGFKIKYCPLCGRKLR